MPPSARLDGILAVGVHKLQGSFKVEGTAWVAGQLCSFIGFADSDVDVNTERMK